MGEFRKKPVVVQATQWFKNGDHPLDGDSSSREGSVVRYYRHPDVSGETPCEVCGLPHHYHGWVDTLEQGHRVCPGDWIITGINGEHYPCKPDIFAKTYEPAELDRASRPAGEAVELTEQEKADRDVLMFGTSFMLHGKRIDPAHIRIEYIAPPAVSEDVRELVVAARELLDSTDPEYYRAAYMRIGNIISKFAGVV